jgi:aspartate kinase
VNDALRLPALHYDEMEALARHGAKVLNLRAVSYARKHGVTIHARSSFHENKGTLVNGKRRKRTQVIGVASLTGLIKLELGQPVTGLVRQAVELCGSDNVYIDATATGGKDLLISTLNIPDHDHLYEELKRHFDGRARLARDIGSVSIVGHGVGRSDESAMRLRSTLDDARNLQGLFSTADTRTCILDKHMVPKMVRTLHQRFVEQQPGLSAVA